MSDQGVFVDLLTGIYQHYKGPLYQVLGYSHNASDGDNEQIVYVPLQLIGAKPGPRMATRDVAEFHELVCTREEHYGIAYESSTHRRHPVPLVHQVTDAEHRFTYLGPVYYPGMEVLDLGDHL